MARTARIPAVLAVLLLAAALPVSPTSQAQGPEEFTITDAKGDVWVPAPNPTGTGLDTPVTSYLDIRSLVIKAEDLESLTLEVRLENLKSAFQQIILGGSIYYQLDFKLDGQSTTYSLYWPIAPELYGGNAPTGTLPAPVRMCLGSQGRGCNSQRAYTTINWDESRIITVVPKASLMGRDPANGNFQPSPDAILPVLAAGSRLTDFVLVTKGESLRSLFTDRMPDAGAGRPYVMNLGAANERIRVRLAHPVAGPEPPFQGGGLGGAQIHELPESSITPGASNLVQFVVENGNAAKRIVTVTAEVADAVNKGRWQLRVLPQLTIPGDQSRTLNLIINASEQLEHRETATIRIVARSVGIEGETGVLKLNLLGAAQPGATRPDLFFHARYAPPPYLHCTVQYPCMPINAWLNTLAEDKSGTQDEGLRMQQQGFFLGQDATYFLQFRLDAPLQDDLVLDVNGTIEFLTNFRTQFAIVGTVSASLFASGAPLAQGSAPITGTSAKISMLPNVEAARIEAGKELTARVTLRIPVANGGLQSGVSPPEFVSKGSKISLPAIPDPRPKSTTAIPLGPGFVTLTLKGDRESFVNPGESRAFRLVVVNEGIQKDTVRLEAALDQRRWSYTFAPGDSYVLTPGDSAAFGLLLNAPKNVTEGEILTALVNATSTSDPGARAQLSVQVTATEGVELDDDWDNFTVDEDSQAKVANRSVRGQSDGPAWVGAAVALTLVLWAGRRRYVE